MTSNVQRVPSGYLDEFRRLIEMELRLDCQVRFDERLLAGLCDFRTILELARVRLELASLVIEGAQDTDLARGKALAAMQALDELRGLSISDDDTDLIRNSQEFGAAQLQLERFLMVGGGVLLEDRIADSKRCRKLAQIVASSVSKYAHRDDTYRPLFRAEKLPATLRFLVKLVLPVLAHEYQSEPPYGLEEGEEEVRQSPRMTVPLPQAIHYLSEEILPTYREALVASPGDVELQTSISILEQRIRYLKELRVYPRATPLTIETGVQTDSMVGFTAE